MRRAARRDRRAQVAQGGPDGSVIHVHWQRAVAGGEVEGGVIEKESRRSPSELPGKPRLCPAET